MRAASTNSVSFKDLPQNLSSEQMAELMSLRSQRDAKIKEVRDSNPLTRAAHLRAMEAVKGDAAAKMMERPGGEQRFRAVQAFQATLPGKHGVEAILAAQNNPNCQEHLAIINELVEQTARPEVHAAVQAIQAEFLRAVDRIINKQT